jgi:hypothetical protein
VDSKFSFNRYLFLAHFPYFENYAISMLSLCLCNLTHQLFNCPTDLYETLFYIYIMATEPISTACFINAFHHSLCLHEYPIVARQRPVKHTPIVPGQRHGKNVSAETRKNRRIV